MGEQMTGGREHEYGLGVFLFLLARKFVGLT